MDVQKKQQQLSTAATIGMRITMVDQESISQERRNRVRQLRKQRQEIRSSLIPISKYSQPSQLNKDGIISEKMRLLQKLSEKVENSKNYIVVEDEKIGGFKKFVANQIQNQQNLCKKILLLTNRIDLIDSYYNELEQLGLNVIAYKSSFKITHNYQQFLEDFENCQVLIMNPIAFFDDCVRLNYLSIDQFDQLLLKDFNFGEFSGNNEKYRHYHRAINKKVFQIVLEKQLGTYKGQENDENQGKLKQIAAFIDETALQYDVKNLKKLSMRLNASIIPALNSENQLQSLTSNLSVFEKLTQKLDGQVKFQRERIEFIMKQIQKQRVIIKDGIKSLIEDQGINELRKFYSQVYLAFKKYHIERDQLVDRDNVEYKRIFTPQIKLEESDCLKGISCSLYLPISIELEKMNFTTTKTFKSLYSAQNNVAIQALQQLKKEGFINQEMLLDQEKLLQHLVSNKAISYTDVPKLQISKQQKLMSPKQELVENEQEESQMKDNEGVWKLSQDLQQSHQTDQNHHIYEEVKILINLDQNDQNQKMNGHRQQSDTGGVQED